MLFLPLSFQKHSNSVVYENVMSMTYGSNGNILSKTGVGSYDYNSSKPHAVAAVDNTSGLISEGTQSVTYNLWGKVSEVNAVVGSDTYRYELTYGPDLQRVLAVLWKNDQLVHLVTYGHDFEEKYLGSHITRYYYVSGTDGNAAVYTSDTSTGDKAYCMDRDHIGSIIGLYDQYGTKCYGASFDPWGKRTLMSGSIEFDRGFTGHEHIDEINLIDMNGRMYDPLLGRFLSADPFVQAPTNPQNFNRYSYCLNNPLKYIDPSGESWLIAGIAAILLLTEEGYNIQKALSPVALHLDVHLGTHQLGLGCDVSVGRRTIFPVSYRKHYGATYYWKTYGGNSGWEYREGGEWGLQGALLGIPYYINFSGTEFSGINSQTTNSVTLSKLPFWRTTYENDTELLVELPGVPKYDNEDRYRTASVSIRRGPFTLQTNLHTGMPDSENPIEGNGTEKSPRHFTGGDIDKQHHGILSLGFGPFRIGWDSEK